MLPRNMYELVPYSCLVLGVVSVLWLDNFPAKVAGGVLYLLGALIWLMRFHYRHPVALSDSIAGSSYPFSEDIYEFKPFLMIAAAVVILAMKIGGWGAAFATVLVFDAGYILLKRIASRSGLKRA